jgi:hypothetical protein
VLGVRNQRQKRQQREGVQPPVHARRRLVPSIAKSGQIGDHQMKINSAMIPDSGALCPAISGAPRSGGSPGRRSKPPPARPTRPRNRNRLCRIRFRGQERRAESGARWLSVISANAQIPRRRMRAPRPAGGAPGSLCPAASLPRRIAGCAARAAADGNRDCRASGGWHPTACGSGARKAMPETHNRIARIAISSQDGWTMR